MTVAHVEVAAGRLLLGCCPLRLPFLGAVEASDGLGPALSVTDDTSWYMPRLDAHARASVAENARIHCAGLARPNCSTSSSAWPLTVQYRGASRPESILSSYLPAVGSECRECYPYNAMCSCPRIQKHFRLSPQDLTHILKALSCTRRILRLVQDGERFRQLPRACTGASETSQQSLRQLDKTMPQMEECTSSQPEAEHKLCCSSCKRGADMGAANTGNLRAYIDNSRSSQRVPKVAVNNASAKLAAAPLVQAARYFPVEKSAKNSRSVWQKLASDFLPPGMLEEMEPPSNQYSQNTCSLCSLEHREDKADRILPHGTLKYSSSSSGRTPAPCLESEVHPEVPTPFARNHTDRQAFVASTQTQDSLTPPKNTAPTAPLDQVSCAAPGLERPGLAELQVVPPRSRQCSPPE